jgi:hypothetical protein
VSAQQLWERTRLARRQEHIAHVRSWLHEAATDCAEGEASGAATATLADIIGRRVAAG